MGRFGEESLSDQFGSQIMFFAKEADGHWSTGRIEYVEVTHAGQAFRLGRYPIHFHLNGDVTGNYVRGCAIHHTFNRAVTIHAVHNLLVEHNVAYNIMGHAYFLEDGIETKNIIQYNLAVFVRSSSSLLNVDVTPASYWVTNPDNIVRHNAAAGGSHFGYWYNAPEHPGGPSFDGNIWPRRIPVLEFFNNTCHSTGWYGLWIFPIYKPVEGSAMFHGLTAWNVQRGAESVEGGNIQFIDFVISEASDAGVEFQTTNDAWGGPLLQNSVIIGHSDISDGSSSSCTTVGLKLPKSKYLTVDGVTFVNFDRPSCTALACCSHCKIEQGGFQSRFKNIQYFDSPNIASFQWEHECWMEDLDGTLSAPLQSSCSNCKILPQNPILPPTDCTFEKPALNFGSVPGAICNDNIKLHRMAFNRPHPDSLLYKNVSMTNEHGTTIVKYHKKRITHGKGWMVTLLDGQKYRMNFQNVDHVTNISYQARLDDFANGDYVMINHNFTQVPDKFAIVGGQVTDGSGDMVDADSSHGDWYFDNTAKVLTYVGK